MKSDVIMINNSSEQIEKALNQVEAVAVYKSLSSKNEMLIRLLAEELLGMVRSILGETGIKFWLEDAEGVYQIHLLAETILNTEKREQLLSAATSGKNEEAKGFMGMLREFFYRTSDPDIPIHGGMNAVRPGAPAFWNYTFEPAVDTDLMFAPFCQMTEGVYMQNVSPKLDYEWSLAQYKNGLDQRRKDDSEALKAWDELEKSVVAKMADEVKVGILGNEVEMVVFKRLS